MRILDKYHFNISKLRWSDPHTDPHIGFPTDDQLDALLCAIQAAWAWTLRKEIQTLAGEGGEKDSTLENGEAGDAAEVFPVVGEEEYHAGEEEDGAEDGEPFLGELGPGS